MNKREPMDELAMFDAVSLSLKDCIALADTGHLAAYQADEERLSRHFSVLRDVGERAMETLHQWWDDNEPAWKNVREAEREQRKREFEAAGDEPPNPEALARLKALVGKWERRAKANAKAGRAIKAKRRSK